MKGFIFYFAKYPRFGGTFCHALKSPTLQKLRQAIGEICTSLRSDGDFNERNSAIAQ